jgi:hypothetical protein
MGFATLDADGNAAITCSFPADHLSGGTILFARLVAIRVDSVN